MEIDPTFVTALEGKKHLMSGLELHLLDVLKGVVPENTRTLDRQKCPGHGQFTGQPLLDEGKFYMRWDRGRINDWFRANFTGLIYC
jgi:hypothetical protein